MNIYILAIAGVSCIAFFIGLSEASKALRLESYYKTIHAESVKFARKMMYIGFIALLADLALFAFLTN
jgi:hypothetical protein